MYSPHIIVVINLLALLGLSACVPYHETAEGGTRVKNPSVFKYNRERFKKADKSLIDTEAIYVMDSMYNTWNTPKWKKTDHIFLRFFPGGQVLFIFCKGLPTAEQVNNPNVGHQGYFTIQGTRLKVDRFHDWNYGGTGKYFGRVKPNGDLVFYERSPESYFLPTFNNLEKKTGKKHYSIWKKVKIKGQAPYTPAW